MATQYEIDAIRFAALTITSPRDPDTQAPVVAVKTDPEGKVRISVTYMGYGSYQVTTSLAEWRRNLQRALNK